MKSFEQIAQAMHEAFLKERRNQGSASTAYAGWDALGKDQQAAWIAAARQAAAELALVH